MPTQSMEMDLCPWQAVVVTARVNHMVVVEVVVEWLFTTTTTSLLVNSYSFIGYFKGSVF